MSQRRRSTSSGKAHRFGGDWTSIKLEVLAKYLRAYTTALKNQPFRKIYIDAFAGTGYRAPRSPQDEEPYLPELGPEGAQLLDGSARIALKTDPAFDRFVFIERDAGRCAQLHALKDEFPDRAADVEIYAGEANDKVRQLCGERWASQRAVLFLDPYGMNVDWATIEAIAATRAIDLWILFPLGMGVNRMLPRSGEPPPSWSARLDRFFGTPEWREAFYKKVEVAPNLFGEVTEEIVKAKTDDIGRFFHDRLRSVFAGVAEAPGVLRNSSNNPLYLLCFAVANERGVAPALRIANHLLKPLR